VGCQRDQHGFAQLRIPRVGHINLHDRNLPPPARQDKPTARRPQLDSAPDGA
jgi:hypothetical protein